MSSLIAIQRGTTFIIATDTLAHIKDPTGIIPTNFTSKTTYLPQFKLCYALQGFSVLNQLVFCFATEIAKAVDITGFIDCLDKTFLQYISKHLDLFPISCIGTLYLFGYSDSAGGMRTYKIIVEKTAIEVNELAGWGLLIKPELLQTDYISVAEANKDDDISLMIELMTLQRKEDAEYELKDMVGIGGQLQITIFQFREESQLLMFNSFMAYTFDDFEDIKRQILD